MHFERLPLDAVDWNHLDSFEDRSVFQTEPWLRFLRSTQGCEPVIAELKDGASTVGYFTGCVFRKFGLKFLGSPFPGWSTSYMGFNLQPLVPRSEAIRALTRFAFKDLRCVHVELMDRRLTTDQAQALGCRTSNFAGYEIDLTVSEDQLFKNMDSDYRRCTRNAEKNGVTVEESSDLDFAVDYYDQLRDVFAKQKLVPTYSLERVSSLLTHLRSTGMLLALRARDSADRCIATGIFLGHNDTAFFWGGASWRDAQILRPNHAIQWYAIRYWRARNVEKYDMGGGGRYKANFGGRRISVPWLRISKYPIFEHPRQIYKSLWKSGQRILGRTLTKA